MRLAWVGIDVVDRREHIQRRDQSVGIDIQRVPLVLERRVEGDRYGANVADHLVDVLDLVLQDHLCISIGDIVSKQNAPVRQRGRGALGRWRNDADRSRIEIRTQPGVVPKNIHRDRSAKGGEECVVGRKRWEFSHVVDRDDNRPFEEQSTLIRRANPNGVKVLFLKVKSGIGFKPIAIDAERDVVEST